MKTDVAATFALAYYWRASEIGRPLREATMGRLDQQRWADRWVYSLLDCRLCIGQWIAFALIWSRTSVPPWRWTRHDWRNAVAVNGAHMIAAVALDALVDASCYDDDDDGDDWDDPIPEPPPDPWANMTPAEKHETLLRVTGGYKGGDNHGW